MNADSGTSGKGASLLDDIAVFSAAQIAAGVILALYVFTAARFLTLEDFAMFQALMGIYGIFNVLSSPLNISTIHAVASAGSAGARAALGYCVKMAFVVGALLAISIAALAPMLGSVMKGGSVWAFLSLAMLLFASSVLTCLYGGLQGMNRYRYFSVVKTIETLCVCVFGTIMMYAGCRSAGAVGGYAMAMTLTAAFLLTRMGPQSPDEPKFGFVHLNLGAIVRPLIVFGMISFLVEFPMIIAKSRLGNYDAGIYSALFSMRSFVFPLAYAVALPLYSRKVSSSVEPWMLGKALAVCLCVAAGFLSVAWFCPVGFISIALGAKFSAASEYMFLYGMALVVAMLSMVLMFHRIVRNSVPLVAVIVPLLALAASAFVSELTIRMLIAMQMLAMALFPVTAVITDGICRYAGGKKKDAN